MAEASERSSKAKDGGRGAAMSDDQVGWLDEHGNLHPLSWADRHPRHWNDGQPTNQELARMRKNAVPVFVRGVSDSDLGDVVTSTSGLGPSAMSEEAEPA